MDAAQGPQQLSQSVSKLLSLRGIAQQRGYQELDEIWRELVSSQIAQQTRVLDVQRSVLRISVNNAPLLSELVLFHRTKLLKQLQEQHPELSIKAIKFWLQEEKVDTHKED